MMGAGQPPNMFGQPGGQPQMNNNMMGGMMNMGGGAPQNNFMQQPNMGM